LTLGSPSSRCTTRKLVWTPCRSRPSVKPMPVKGRVVQVELDQGKCQTHSGKA
jgi:hypothetical protein